jgi:MFS family permease
MSEPASPTLKLMQSRAYRGWVLVLFMLVALFGFADRQIITALAQPIKRDLGLTDAELGLLAGLAFALLNSLATIPIARIADRGRRLTLISIGIFIWSIATALCGMAQSFLQLVAARLSVGMGEATGGPATVSVLADYFPPDKRASAAAIFGLAIPLGALLGAAGGGFIAQHYDWRMAFVIAGAPGVFLGLLVATTIREPLRGHYDKGRSAQASPPPFTAVLARMVQKPAFLHTVIGSTLVSTGGFGIISFNSPYLIRRFGLDVGQAGLITGLISAAPGVVCMLAAGFLADRLGRRDVRFYGWVPAAGGFLATPLYILSFQQGTWLSTTIMLMVTGLFQYAYLPISNGLYQNLMEPRMRASAIAVVGAATNLISASLGPFVVGALSDGLAARAYHGAGAFAASCVGKGIAPSGACLQASAGGLQLACSVFALIYLWGGLHYVLAARTLKRDLA